MELRYGQPTPPPDSADVFGDDHPIFGEAVAWLAATDTVPLDREMAANLLPHWPHSE